MLTIRGQGFRRGARVLIGGKAQRGARLADANTLRVPVRCLKRGVLGITIVSGGRRTAEARALTVTGKGCATRKAKPKKLRKAKKKPKRR